MRTTKPNRLYAVITADVVHSRRLPRFPPVRDARLRLRSRLHLDRKLVLQQYTVTTWDEFQNILADLSRLPPVILDLRRYFYPLQLRIAVGIGEVTQPHRKPLNVFAAGEAFELARQAMENLKSGKSQKLGLTQIKSANEQFDRVANLIYNLHDTLLEQVSAKQWKTINVQMETQQQQVTARRLRLDESTVSRNLQRAFYWQMEKTIEVMSELLKAQFGNLHE